MLKGNHFIMITVSCGHKMMEKINNLHVIQYKNKMTDTNRLE